MLHGHRQMTQGAPLGGRVGQQASPSCLALDTYVFKRDCAMIMLYLGGFYLLFDNKGAGYA